MLTLFLINASIILLLIIWYFYYFYPQQVMPVGKVVPISTPQFEKYRNDCLHPCIRYIPEGFAGARWWMVQSPYYERNSKIENPILYSSKTDPCQSEWNYISIVKDTPSTGFNSDPALFYEDGVLWVFWREKNTPLCNELSVRSAIVGVSTRDGKKFTKPKVFFTQEQEAFSMDLCPILIKKKNRYYFYSAYYQLRPVRKSMGIAIWKGSSLDNPDFVLFNISTFKPIFVCDKYKQLKLFNRLIFFPKPLIHEVWHFDLFDYNGKLYMLSVAEWGDNIVLSVSDDYVNFKHMRKPLVNSHFIEQLIGFRTYFYKPTGLIYKNSLILYYTIKGSIIDKNSNQLYCAKKDRGVLEIIF